MPTAPARLSVTTRGWIGLWLLAGVGHVTQAIWMSGFAALPAGLGDGRFNHLVLEHGYLSLRGIYDWTSPGQFFPVPHTLGWSDTHLGTLPLYIALRLLGMPSEVAMQGWFILCATLNLLCGYHLLRRLELPPRWAAPVTFTAFASVPMVWLTGTHPQMLPLFPGLLALGELHDFLRTKHRRHLYLGGGAFAGQFAAAPYSAFFISIIGTFLFLSYLLIQGAAWKQRPARLETAARTPRQVAAWVIAGFGWLTGAIATVVYLGTMQSGTGRPLAELVELAPKWTSWLTTPPGQRWYALEWQGTSLDPDKHALFPGFIPLLISLTALLTWRPRIAALHQTAALLAFAALMVIGFFLTWPNGFSLWLTAGETFEPLRAFRAAGRVSPLVHALLAVSAGLMFHAWWTDGRRMLAIAGMTLLVLESLAERQPRYTIAEAQARRAAVIDAWAAAGDRPVLAFAPGFTNQPSPDLNLDAWAAALATQRVTLNGYTGGAPSSHLPFLWSPTAENAYGLIHLLGIPEETVSVVTRLAPEAAAAIGYESFVTRPLQTLDGFMVQPYAWTLLTPVERWVYDDWPYYQFTPPATVSFRLPDHFSGASWLVGARPGSYDNGGDSDGFSLNWRVIDAGDRELASGSRFLNPRDVPADRGFLPQSIELPAGTNRRLEFEFGPGPSGLTNWDWPLLGKLELR